MAGLSSLFENKLFLQMLSGGGAALQRGDPISAGLDPITQQNIGAQSKAALNQRYMKMLSALLGPGKDFKSDAAGKITVTDGTKKISGTLGDILGASALKGLDEGLEEGIAETGGLNPFVSSLPSGADLAGLTAADVSQALTGAVKVEQLRADIPYKRALTRQAIAAATPKVEPTFVRGVPGYGDMTLSQYKTLPTSDKEYVSYVLATKEMDEKPLSKREYEALDDDEKGTTPTTAMGAAIAQWSEDHNGELPPPKVMAEWSKLFKGEPPKKTPTLMTWNQASSKLQERFGKLDPTGKWAVTEDLQRTHRKAQEFLEENRAEGKMHPLEAINDAETRARKTIAMESKYFDYLDDAQNVKNEREREARIEAIKSKFHAKFKYLPERNL